MTIQNEDHYRTFVHPIYVIMVNPIGKTISHLLGSNLTAAMLINCFFGALAVVLGFVFFWVYTWKLVNSLLLACLFGVSTSQFFLSIIPDTATMAICSLIVTYIIFFIALRDRQMPFAWWVLAGLFAFGVTTTNFIQAILCYFIYLVVTKNRRGILSGILKYILAVLLLAVPLSILQRILYPSAGIFFLPDFYKEELDYITPLLFTHPLMMIGQLLKSFLFDNLIAPLPKTLVILHTMSPGVTFTKSWEYLLAGKLAIAIWLYLFISGIVTVLKNKRNRLFFIGVACCILFNFVLHAIYGVTENKPNQVELFLYSGNITFLIIALLSEKFSSNSIMDQSLLISLIFLIGLNNYSIMNRIIHYYQPILGETSYSKGHTVNEPDLQKIMGESGKI